MVINRAASGFHHLCFACELRAKLIHSVSFKCVSPGRFTGSAGCSREIIRKKTPGVLLLYLAMQAKQFKCHKSVFWKLDWTTADIHSSVVPLRVLSKRRAVCVPGTSRRLKLGNLGSLGTRWEGFGQRLDRQP